MDDNDKIANCLIRTIADKLKACDSCAFRIGLAFRLVKQNETLNTDCLLRIEELRVVFIELIR